MEAFSVDTSVLIHIFDHYSEDDPSQKFIIDIFFQNLAEKDSGFFISDIAFNEFKNPEIQKKIKEVYPQCIVPSIPQIQKIQKQLQNRYPSIINPRKTRNQADLFVIAVAKYYEMGVLTDEVFKKHNRENFEKIPNKGIKRMPEVCEREKIVCFDLTTYLASLLNRENKQ